MAIIKCPECNKKVSDKAEACPCCGFGVLKYIERQEKIAKIQEEAGAEAYLYVKRRKNEEWERAEQIKRATEERKNGIYDKAISLYVSESFTDVEEAEALFLSIPGWKDSDTYLEKCRGRIDEFRQQEIVQKEKNRKKKRKIIIIIAVCLIAAGIVSGGYGYYKAVVVPQNIYDSAVNNIQEGNYEEAIKQLETIVEYKDVAEKLVEVKYLEAENLAGNQEYAEALKLLEEIEDKRDVRKQKVRYENAVKYEEALTMMESENYKAAIDLLKYNDFDTDDEKLKECYVKLAYEELEKEEYDSALEYFELADYQGEGYQRAYYEKGVDAYEGMLYDTAIECFEIIVDYKDSADMLSKIKDRCYISDTDRKLMCGYWYKAKADRGGRVIAIDTDGESRKLWTGWDNSYTLDSVKEKQAEFELNLRYEDDCIVNNGNGTYSVLTPDGSGENIEYIVFKISEGELEIISVFYENWQDEIGIYRKF